MCVSGPGPHQQDGEEMALSLCTEALQHAAATVAKIWPNLGREIWPNLATLT